MDTTTDKIDKLYKNYEILSDAKAKESILEVRSFPVFFFWIKKKLTDAIIFFLILFFQHEKEYKEILEAVKGGDKEKRLASQFIGKFFKYFPTLADIAIDAQLDLCEDEDVQIRRQAIKDLPLLCKETKEHTPRIADILAQLLLAEDAVELQQVHMSLQALAKVCLIFIENLRSLFIVWFLFALVGHKRNFKWNFHTNYQWRWDNKGTLF